jgi:hypothetical protein
MLAAQRKEHQNEPETLRRHREMYEERLQYLHFTQGKTEKEVTDKANSPRVFNREDSESQSDSEKSTTPSTSEK